MHFALAHPRDISKAGISEIILRALPRSVFTAIDRGQSGKVQLRGRGYSSGTYARASIANRAAELRSEAKRSHRRDRRGQGKEEKERGLRMTQTGVARK